MTRQRNSHDWGVIARSFFWFVQASALSTFAAVVVGMGDGGLGALAIAAGAAFLSVVLLFRQIHAIVDQKLDGRTEIE